MLGVEDKLVKTRKRTQDWLSENSRRCGTRKSGLPAHLITDSIFDFFCGASLSYRSMQSCTTKIEDLIQNMKALMGSLNSDTLAKVC
jgi:hypothetical protein